MSDPCANPYDDEPGPVRPRGGTAGFCGEFSGSVEDTSHPLPTQPHDDRDAADPAPVSDERAQRIVAKAMELKRRRIQVKQDLCIYESDTGGGVKSLVLKASGGMSMTVGKGAWSAERNECRPCPQPLCRPSMGSQIFRFSHWLGRNRSVLAATVALAGVLGVGYVAYFKQSPDPRVKYPSPYEPLSFASQPPQQDAASTLLLVLDTGDVVLGTPESTNNPVMTWADRDADEDKDETRLTLSPQSLEGAVTVSGYEGARDGNIDLGLLPDEHSQTQHLTDESSGSVVVAVAGQQSLLPTFVGADPQDPLDEPSQHPAKQNPTKKDPPPSPDDATVADANPSESANAKVSPVQPRPRLPLLVEQAEWQLMEEYWPDWGAVGVRLGKYADSYRFHGQHDLAGPLFERALYIIGQTHGTRSLPYAELLHDLGQCLHELGDYDRALEAYHEALAIREAAPDTEHKFLAWNEYKIAEIYCDQGEYQQAVAWFKRSRETSINVSGFYSPDTANALIGIARVNQARGKFIPALEQYHNALTIRQEVLRPNDQRIADVNSRIGRLYQDWGKLKQARSYFEDALKLTKKNYDPQHPAVAVYRLKLAGVYEAQGDSARASRELRESTKALERSIKTVRATRSPLQQLPIARVARQYLDHRLSKKSTRYDEVLRFKGIITRAAGIEKFAARRRADAPATDDPATDNPKRSQGPAYQRQVNTTVAAAPEEGGQSISSTTRKSIGAPPQRRVTPQPYRPASQRLEITLTDVQAKLRSAERLVDFIRYTDTDRRTDLYAAWVVASQGEPIRVELGPTAPIDQSIGEFRRSIVGSDTSSGAASSTDPAFKKTGMQLYEKIWKPLAKHLDQEDVTTIYLAPDGALATVPFAALPRSGYGREFLIDRYTIAYLTFAQDLVPWAASPRSGRGILTIGGVDYDHTPTGSPNNLENRPAPAPPLLRTKHSSAAQGIDRLVMWGLQFSPLPRTRREARRIYRQFSKMTPQEPRTFLRGDDATEDRLRQLAPGKRFLHLATHGYAVDDPAAVSTSMWHKEGTNRTVIPDTMQRSYLALAGINRDPNQRHGHDGALTALEVSCLDLEGVELAVLSACGGEAGQDHGGVRDLVQGFKQAGVGAVVANLWPVEDQKKQVLLEQLYATILRDPSTRSPAQALRAAVLTLRKGHQETATNDKAEKWRDPHAKTPGHAVDAPKHWAAFVAYGPLR